MSIAPSSAPFSLRKSFFRGQSQKQANQLAPAPDPQERIAQSLETLSAILQKHYGSPTVSENATPSVEKVLAESPIAQWLSDENVTDILINGTQDIYIGKGGVLEQTQVRFTSEAMLQQLAEAIAASVGRPLDPERPLADARLIDGSRVNIIAPPMAVNGLCISIRKFPKQDITLDSLVETGSMTAQMAAFFKACAKARVSILISGGTGTGKTTLLNAISHNIPTQERIVTIEDTAELRLQQPHVIRLETKEASVLGQRRDEVTTSDLLRNALRMRPDRIIVGEVRGEEAFDMIQAMNTGHDGSMATIHANTPRDALARMEGLLGPRAGNTPALSLRRQIVSAINLVIQLSRTPEGRYFISQIAEITGMEGEIPTMQDIFSTHEQLNAHNQVEFEQVWNQIIPRHARLAELLRAENIFKIEV